MTKRFFKTSNQLNVARNNNAIETVLKIEIQHFVYNGIRFQLKQIINFGSRFGNEILLWFFEQGSLFSLFSTSLVSNMI